MSDLDSKKGSSKKVLLHRNQASFFNGALRMQAKNEPPQLQRRRLLLRYWAAALDATGELVLHAGSLETVVATDSRLLDQAQLKQLLGEAPM